MAILREATFQQNYGQPYSYFPEPGDMSRDLVQSGLTSGGRTNNIIVVSMGEFNTTSFGAPVGSGGLAGVTFIGLGGGTWYAKVPGAFTGGVITCTVTYLEGAAMFAGFEGHLYSGALQAAPAIALYSITPGAKIQANYSRALPGGGTASFLASFYYSPKNLPSPTPAVTTPTQTSQNANQASPAFSLGGTYITTANTATGTILMGFDGAGDTGTGSTLFTVVEVGEYVANPPGAINITKNGSYRVCLSFNGVGIAGTNATTLAVAKNGVLLTGANAINILVRGQTFPSGGSTAKIQIQDEGVLGLVVGDKLSIVGTQSGGGAVSFATTDVIKLIVERVS